MTFVLLQAEQFKFYKHADGSSNLDMTLRQPVATETSCGRDAYEFKFSEFFIYHQVYYTKICNLSTSEFVCSVNLRKKSDYFPI